MSEQNLRQETGQRREAYSSEQLHQMSQPIIRALLAHPRLISAHTVLLYASLADEVDTHEPINTLLRQGKTLLLPVVVDDHAMKTCRYIHGTNVGHGAFGIMEPQADAFTNYKQTDLTLVPGAASDRRDHRLGQGKGYYNRLLSQARDCYRIGVCFPSRLVGEVPTDEHDVRMDEIITQKYAED